MRPAELLRLLKDAWDACINAHPTRLAAAISFYAAFSLAPLTVLGVWITGWIARDPDFISSFSLAIRALLGAHNARTVEGLVGLAAQGEWSLQATAFGIVSLVFGATGIFAEVQAALNTIWHAPVAESFWKCYLRQRATPPRSRTQEEASTPAHPGQHHWRPAGQATAKATLDWSPSPQSRRETLWKFSTLCRWDLPDSRTSGCTNGRRCTRRGTLDVLRHR